MSTDHDIAASGWTIDGEPVTDAEAAAGLASVDDLDALMFRVSVGDHVIAEGLGLEGVEAAVERVAELPMSATFTERLCYAIAATSVCATAWSIMGLGGERWSTALSVCVVVGMVMVNRRVGLGPLD